VLTARQSRPPGPKNPPLLGQVAKFRRDPPAFLTSVAKAYGDIAYFRLGQQNAFLLSHPDYIRDVLITNQHSFIKSRMLQRAKTLLGEGLLTSEAPLHTRQRRLVQPAFHRSRLAGYAEMMIAYAVRTRDHWHDGESLDVAVEMMRLTLAVVAKTLFNADVESEAKEIGESLSAILHLFDIVMMPFSELIEKLPLPAIKRFHRAKDRLDQTIYRIINERRASGEDRGDLLSMLLLAQDEEGTGGMTDEQVRDEALTIFLAGHETTANALTWTWYLLSQNPEVEARFHEEIDRVLSGRVATPDDFAQLKYTEMVFAESLRLYPPAWGIGRMATKDYEVAGYTIEPGAIILMSPYVVHRDPRFFPEPDRFDPQRWTPEQKAARPKFSFFPFGGGARVCIGEHFAWMEGVLMLATIGQRWRLRLEPGHPVAHKALLTLRPKFGMRMIVQARV
jgi:cytochrome P450